MPALASLASRPLLSLTALAFLARVLTSALLVLLSQLQPSFDSSAQPLLNSTTSLVEPFLRWDTLYFANIATRGYVFEQELAFSPGLPALMRLAGKALGGEEELSVHWAVLGGVGVSWLAGVAATVVLFLLTQQVTNNNRFAFLTATLFLIPPSPPTLNAVPYTEPYAALFTFLGMLLFARSSHALAALAWALGTAFRAQCMILGVGFFGWKFVLQEPWRGTRFSARVFVHGLPKFVLLSAVAVLPFVGFQAWAYDAFCDSVEDESRRPWCDQGIGFNYGWVQDVYWNNGLFRYWTPNNIPNFAFAAPVLALSFAASYTFYTQNAHSVVSSTLPFLPANLLPPPPSSPKSTSSKTRPAPRPFLAPHLTPYVHLHTALTLLLLFASHTQIILRLCSSNPVVWWYAAHLCSAPSGSKERKWGGRWVKYCVVWGTVACVLWASFLPPA